MPPPTEAAARASAETSPSPPPTGVPGNLWTAIDVPEVGRLEARATVSVLLTGPDPEGRLALTLASLTEQSYPRSLMEVVVETDGGEAERAVADAAGDLTVRTAPPGEAERGATGDVVIFLRTGAIAERELVEAHARWHHAVADAVTAGSARRIEAGSLEVGEVREAVSGGNLEPLLRARGAAEGEDDDERAAEDFVERSRGLTERRPDVFRVAGRGSLGVRADTLRAAGEPAPVRDDRLRRLDLAYRLDLLGCVFVPERAARAYGAYREPWGARPGATGDAAASDGAAGDDGGPEEGERDESGLHGVGPASTHDPRAASLLPVGGFRPRGSGRVFDRPAMVVEVRGEEEGASEVLEAVDAVLRGRLSDLLVQVRLPAGHPERTAVEAACAADPRIEVTGGGRGASHLSPYRVTMPAAAMPDDRTLDAIHELMTAESLGALHLTMPSRVDRLPLGRLRLADRVVGRSTVEVVATGAEARAARVSEHDGRPVEAVLARLFGERRMHGAEAGIRRRGSVEPEANRALAPASDLAHERAEHLRYRARAATSQARVDRQAQRLFRERLRASHERTRADRLDARLARLSPPYWVRWKARRVVRRLVALPRRLGRRVARVRQPLYRLKQAAVARLPRGGS